VQFDGAEHDQRCADADAERRHCLLHRHAVHRLPAHGGDHREDRAHYGAAHADRRAAARFGLGAFGWSDTPLVTAPSGVTAIKKVHIDQLRSALAAAYTAHGVSPPAPTYTEPTITQFVTTVKAVHINELRAAAILLENTP
jgi:hypothetical protein